MKLSGKQAKHLAFPGIYDDDKQEQKILKTMNGSVIHNTQDGMKSKKKMKDVPCKPTCITTRI